MDYCYTDSRTFKISLGIINVIDSCPEGFAAILRLPCAPCMCTGDYTEHNPPYPMHMYALTPWQSSSRY